MVAEEHSLELVGVPWSGAGMLVYMASAWSASMRFSLAIHASFV